jgi:Zn-dependent protease with chaperone function
VRLDTANRSFVGIAAVGFAGHMVLGMAACVLVAVAAYRLAAEGIHAVTGDGWELVPVSVFLLPVAGGALLGLRSLARQIRSSFRLRRRIRALAAPPGDEVVTASRDAGLGGRVVVIDAKDAFSFTYGALTPRVAVSRGLIERASSEELGAVLEHEGYHVRNLDPLKVILVRSLASTFFYLPALRDLRSRYTAGRELAADRRAAEARGRAPLAGALMKVVRGPNWKELQTAPAIGGPELLDVRVKQLEMGSEPPLDRISRTALSLSGAALLGLATGFAVAIAAYGGPSAVARTLAPGTGFSAADVLVCLACGIPFAVLGWVAWRWLSHRAASPLDTTQS